MTYDELYILYQRAVADVVRLSRQNGEQAVEIERLTEAWVDGKMREDRDALLAERDALAARLAEAERDAKRYRWLRDRAWPFEFNGNTPEDADAAIDAAMHSAARPAAAKKHTPECSYWDGLMAQVCNCGLTERCCVDYPRCDCNSPPESEGAE